MRSASALLAFLFLSSCSAFRASDEQLPKYSRKENGGIVFTVDEFKIYTSSTLQDPTRINYRVVSSKTRKPIGSIRSRYVISESDLPFCFDSTKFHWAQKSSMLVIEEGTNWDSPRLLRVFMIGELRIREIHWEPKETANKYSSVAFFQYFNSKGFPVIWLRGSNYSIDTRGRLSEEKGEEIVSDTGNGD